MKTRGDRMSSAGAASVSRWPADTWAGPVLIVRLSSLGDVILTSGPIRLLKQRRPDLELHLLTRAPFASLMREQPGLEHVISADRAGSMGSGFSARGESSLEFKTVLDWQSGPRGLRASRAWAPHAERVGYSTASLRRRGRVWFGARLPAPDPFVVRLARSIAGRRLAAGDLRPFIAPPRPAEVDAIDSILNASPRPKRGWAVLAPSASKPLKCVDSELMNAIETELAERGFGTARLLDRRESREPSRNEFRWRAAARLDFRGDLLAIRALLSRAELYVGSDSGILHLATACDVPAVGLFGPTAPELGFAPLGRSLAVGVDLPCRPCHVHGPRTCWLGHRRCWRDLRPEAVLTAIDSLLAERAGAGRGRCEAGKRTERNGTQRSDAD